MIAETKESSAAVTEHLDFTLSLHHRLAPGPDRAFCWSPYSVVSALGLLAAAANGPTRREITEALRVASSSGDDLSDLLKLLGAAAEVGDPNSSHGPVLAVANTLWAHEELPLEESYVQGLSDWPGSAIRNAPFRSAPEQARQEINADIAETTRDLIPELLAPDAIDPETVATLVNALYLKTSWSQAFAESSTAPKPFHAPAGTRDVATMHVTRRLGYARRDGWQAVTLPAAGGVEAVALLPDDGLDSVESRLDGARLEALLSSSSQEYVELFLPKFEVNGDAQLERSLGELGARTLFTPSADFSGLTTYPLKVSAIAHEAVLRVDENGLEGAAATAAMMRLTAVVREPDPIRVDVDRPFLFLVRHRDTGAVYFLARVVDPG